MKEYHVTGGTKLNGSVRIGGAKNASYKLMIASLLGNSESRLLNFSRISDVQLVSEIIHYLGAGVRRSGERAIFIDPSTLESAEINPEHGAQGRFSTIFIPPLISRFGQAIVPAPGGDKLGVRPLERHFEGLKAMGISVEQKDGLFHAYGEKLNGTEYRFSKNTHTGTETLIMAAVLAKGTTVLENAAEEPEIDDLILFLNHMGARIERVNHRTIVIEGVEKLNGAIHKIIPDRNEAVSYACAALATKGDIIIENARKDHLAAFLEKLSQAGAGFEIGNYGIRFYYRGSLQATHVTTEIEPGFMTDWQPLWATLMTQAEGESTLHETIYPSRFQYVDHLRSMGAEIEYFQPLIQDKETVYNFNVENDAPDTKHAIRIKGPSQLKAKRIKVLDLRHGASLVLAAMAAEGTTVLENIEQIERGYEDLEKRLNSMGAAIKRVEK